MYYYITMYMCVYYFIKVLILQNLLQLKADQGGAEFISITVNFVR